jgi:hypothetical protein
MTKPNETKQEIIKKLKILYLNKYIINPGASVPSPQVLSDQTEQNSDCKKTERNFARSTEKAQKVSTLVSKNKQKLSRKVTKRKK